MPQGPNGIPRLTDIGPLVKDAKELDRGEIWIETKREANRRIESEFIEYSSFTDNFHDVDGEERGEIVTIQMKYKEWDTIMGNTDFFTYTGARVTYAMTDIGYIHKIKVNSDLRRLGIGTELMEMAVSDIQDSGVRTVYTKAVSKAGDELTEEFGFTRHKDLNTLNPQNEWKSKNL